jgi:adenylate cyclase
MAIRAFSIGRKPDNDIVLNHESISRLHAELVLTDDGRAYLTDCGSSCGTGVMRQGKWENIQQAFIDTSELLRFGKYEIAAGSLLAQIPRREISSPPPSASDVSSQSDVTQSDMSPLGVPVRRDPETGEIIPDRQ